MFSPLRITILKPPLGLNVTVNIRVFVQWSSAINAYSKQQSNSILIIRIHAFLIMSSTREIVTL